MAVAVTGDARKRRALYGVMLSVFLAAMESTVVATAMPTVVASLGGVHIYSWVFSGFLLTSTVTMPLWGRVSDLFGRRPVYLGGLGIFLLGSALSGASQDMVQLIGFRMLQGLGAGSLMTLGMTMIGELFGLEQRARMQGYVSGMWGVASLLGPLLGGLLTDLGSWRWVFYVNLPFGAVAIALLAGALPDATVRRPHAFDWTGVALFTSGISALLVGILEAGRIGVWTCACRSPSPPSPSPRSCRWSGARASRSCPSGCSATAWCSPPASMGSSRAWRCSARSRSCRCSCSTSAGCRQRRPASCSCRSCWAGWLCRS